MIYARLPAPRPPPISYPRTRTRVGGWMFNRVLLDIAVDIPWTSTRTSGSD